ncbi:MAG TPA: zinc-dependent metalloprotease [Candidatus Krumholzibacteria bacterium]|nr:zinc-dependent metalloprotease [Candidatus Krumholzibacteria bacterium]
MYRHFGVIALLACLCLVTGAAFATDLTNPATTPSLMSGDAPMTGGKPDMKKQMKERPYAEYLHRKVEKPKGPSGPEPKYKPWDKVVTKEHKKSEGLLNLYTKQEETLLQIPKSQMDKPMLAILSISRGIGSDFVYGGLPIDDIMFDFHRTEDHIQMRRLSTNFTAGEDKALNNALNLTFCESIIETFPIKAEKGDNVIIDVSDFFLSDVSNMSAYLGGALGQPVRLDSKKGYLASIANFPTNTEIDTRLTYSPGRAEMLFLPNVPDARAIQLGVAWSVRELPADPMMPRIADDRVGYFTTSHKDFSREKEESFFVHYANKWRLEKKDPSATVSEPKTPIVYYIDSTVPDEYVPYMMKGVERWQKAFEAAGFKNAIIAKRAPTKEEDPNYDPTDARYNTIRWNVNDQVAYGAIGPSRVDPRTGEIIDADILFEHTIVANFGKNYRRLAEPRTALMQVDPGLKQLWMSQAERDQENALMQLPYFKMQPYAMCQADQCLELGAEVMRLSMLANNQIEAGGVVPLEYLGNALSWVTSHEVGHTLGLRHNFKSSGATPYDELNDKSKIDEIGMTGSVMDYPSPNVAKDSSKQGYYYSPTVGTGDVWAIKWAYMPVEGKTAWEQKEQTDKIAALCTDKGNLYGTDEDTYPAGALDPRSNINDLSDNPMAWASERAAICNDLMMNGKLEDRVVTDGGDYVPLRSAVQTLFTQKFVCANIATKNIGGMYTERAHKGGDKLPFTPVPAADQRKALKFVVDNALTSNAYALSPQMLAKMQDDKMNSWENDTFAPGRRFEFPLTDWVEAMQTGVLFNLMNPMLQSRVVESQYLSDDAFKLSELYSTLTKSIWTDRLAPKGRTATWDRNLQLTYTSMLINQMVTPSPVTPEETVALSRLHLSRIRAAAKTQLASKGLDDDTNAHLMETVARIDRALNANRQMGY